MTIQLKPANRSAIRSQEGIIAESNTYKVQYHLINTRTKFNVREHYEGIEELGDNIHENGLLQPLLGEFVVGNDGITRFDLTDGFRRERALAYNKSIGREVGEIPCRLKQMNLEERYIAMFVTQDNAKLRDVEISNLFRHLVNLGVKPADIAKKVSKSITYVNDMLILSGQTEAVKLAVNEGKAAATAVIKSSKVEGPDKVKELVTASIAKNEKFTVKKAEEAIENVHVPQTKLVYERVLSIPSTLDQMLILEKELLDKPDRKHHEVKFLNELQSAIKIRQDAEKPIVVKKKEDAGFEDSIEAKLNGTILYSEFCGTFCEEIGTNNSVKIFNWFKLKLLSE